MSQILKPIKCRHRKQSSHMFVNQVKIPWLTTRTTMISTPWQGCWSCTSEDWRTPSSQKSASWTSSQPSVSHAQQNILKPSQSERENTPCSFLEAQLYWRRERHAVKHMEAISPAGLIFTRKPVGRGECGPHQSAVCEFTTQSFPRCFYSNSLITQCALGVWWKAGRGHLLKCQITVFSISSAFCFCSLWSILLAGLWCIIFQCPLL